MAELEPGSEGSDAEEAGEAVEGEPKIDLPYYEQARSVLKDEPTIFAALAARNTREQKAGFLSGDIANPVFVYRDPMTTAEHQERIAFLDSLERDLRGESNVALKSLYLAKDEELRHQLTMRLNIGSDPRAFAEASRWLYGQPDEAAFALAVEERRARKNEPEEVELSDEKGRKLPAEEIRLAFNRAIEELGIPGWEAIIHGSAAAITIDKKFPGGPKVKIPPGREVTIATLEELIQHEIMTHVARTRSGQLSSLALIGPLGADKYATTEEGLATYSEQEVATARGREPKNAGLRGTLAIGAAMDGRNFRETYQFLRGLGYSEDKAWHGTSRAFRGVADTSKKDGNVCTFDWTYRIGNIGVWDFVHTKGEAELDRLWVGKVGIHHLGILSELGITQPAIKRRYLRIEHLMPELFST